MFSNLTQREKVLAGATGATLVFALIFGGFMYFMSVYNANEAQLRAIQTRLDDEQAKTLRGVQAAKRKSYYVGTSISGETDIALNQYIAWLTKTLRDELKVKLDGVDRGTSDRIRYEGKQIATRLKFTIRPELTLNQLVNFLHQFYSVDTMHRITTLELNPRSEGTGSKRTRTGILKATIQIEVLAMDQAGVKREVANHFKDAGLSLAEAQSSIVRRDIFGAANNAPTVKATARSFYEPESSASIRITARDADEEDQLNMEVVSSEIDGVDLKVGPTGRSGTLKVPGQKEGSYQVVLRVTDDGLPVKTAEKTVTLVFKEKKQKKPNREKQEPPLKMAVETRITGNLRDRHGDWVVLIKSRMDGKSFRLKVGESFQLDGQSWQVVDITSDSSTFRVGDEELTFVQGDAFTAPVKRKRISVAKVD